MLKLQRTFEERNAMVRRTIEAQILRGHGLGVQVTAYLEGELAIDTWAGLADPLLPRAVDGDTLFNVFSVTKAVTATALHIQANRGLIDYETPVARYWPEYAAHGKEATTVRHVLTHRACIPQMPTGVTPQKICDWDWMCREIAELKPLAPPGTKTLYLSMTFGWVVGELVRRTDPQHRSLGQFIREEIAIPLGIRDLWVGLPRALESRVARLQNASPHVPAESLPPLYAASMPRQVDLIPEVFERTEVRCAEVPGVGGIFNARSEARFWAMLAQGGELDGVRLLSKELVSTFGLLRSNGEEKDPVMFNLAMPISVAGFWLGSANPPVCAVRSPHAICHPGAGGSIGWADGDRQLAVAICHNRMFQSSSCADDPLLPIADAVRDALQVSA
jgi:CubicO group peptidase (beta-lactamase class C family)